MRKKKNYAVRWMTLCVLLFLGIFFLLNLRMAMEPIKQFAKRELTLTEFTSEIKELYISDKFTAKNTFININGLFARLSGQKVCNETVLLKNGMLSKIEIKRNMPKQADAVEELNTYLTQKEIPFLFVQAPYKIDPEEALLPAGVDCYAHENAEEFVALMKEKNINLLDLRPYISNSVELIEKYYYRTDHHWNYDGAFYAFQLICDKISAMFPEHNMDLIYADKDQWESHTLENWFLGSRGKRVGTWFAGTDDFTWYTPAFETAMSCSIPKNRQIFSGDFATAIINNKYLEEKSYFEHSTYVTFVGGDYPVVQHRNRMPSSNLRILMIKDSYVTPVSAFLSTVFSEIDVIDPRHLTECTVAEYIGLTNPDLVIMMINPSSLCTKYYLDFGVDEALALGEPDTEPLWQKDITVKPSATNNYQYTTINLENNKAYTVSFDDVEFLQGGATCVTAVLYNRTTKTYLCSYIFDLEYARKKGEFTWSFTTPDVETDNIELLLYAGPYGKTKDISVKYRNVKLFEWIN